MADKVWVQGGHGCGVINARVFRGQGSRWTDEQLAYKADGELWREWHRAPVDSLEEKLAEWNSWYKSIREMLAKLVKDGVITQAEADAALEEWLKENPDPNPPISVDVGIPVVLPKRESVER